MKVSILDTETASLEGGVCDLAIVTIDDNFEVVRSIESLVDPERPISPSAMGIHHITNEMVEFEPTLSEFMDVYQQPLHDGIVVCGHNVAFDIRMLSAHMPKDHKRLCTLRLARDLWPDLENHQLQTIRYTFGLEAGPAHRAMGDVITCFSLLKHINKTFGLTLEQMVEQCSRALPPTYKLTFGKHKGTALKDLPSSYVYWLLNKTESLDPDLRVALSAL